ncbi:MAG: DUF2513 domain-containing protein [Balneolaceae bacterium]|nr:DUF2513 domain-containing protein [Balneolaceae bacterium]MBO6544797.1 DUF2513 domain-containing protein [Balneolaceae bacterium]MBO6646193.1 DUF2513 domain-containing protein [Balneolaceae bacterium]
MKRDYDLIKKILERIEEFPTTAGDYNIELVGYTDEEISFNSYLLDEAGLIEASFTKFADGSYELDYLNRLTWQGHEFLDNARNETVWKKTLAIVKKKGGSVSFNIFQNLLQSQATKLFEGL